MRALSLRGTVSGAAVEFQVRDNRVSCVNDGSLDLRISGHRVTGTMDGATVDLHLTADRVTGVAKGDALDLRIAANRVTGVACGDAVDLIVSEIA